MSTIISSSTYFPTGNPHCHPPINSYQLYLGQNPFCSAGCNVSKTVCYSIPFSVSMGLSSGYITFKPSTIILQENSLSRYTFLTLAFLSWASFSSPPFLLLIESLPVLPGGLVGSWQSWVPESVRPQVIHYLCSGAMVSQMWERKAKDQKMLGSQ